MEIEFDARKDAENVAKHGVSLGLGIAVLLGRVGEAEDTRRDYGEVRVNAFGFVEGRLFACTYTRRGDVYRIISVRRARAEEAWKWLASG